MKIIEAEAGNLVQRLTLLLEAGAMFSAKNKAAIQTCIDSLQSIIDGVTVAESELSESEISFDERQQELRDAIRVMVGGGKDVWVYLMDVYDTYAVYRVESNIPNSVEANGEKTYRIPYSILDGQVTLGKPTEVERVVSYVPVGPQNEAASFDLSGDVIPLVEASAINKDGIARVKVISPGIGSSGYYSPELLKASAAKFAGAQSYWDHPSTTEEATRPERSLRDLAGKVTNTVWDENGPTGPGIYADVQVFKPYIEAVKELAPHIGMSIRATGTAKYGEVNGKKLPVIEGIETVKSVDFVTQAGRGGEILQLFEAARSRPEQPNERSTDVTEEEAKALRESVAAKDAENAELKTKLARHEEAALETRKGALVEKELAGIKMPDPTRKRLSESLRACVVVAEGVIDETASAKAIQEAAKAEMDYIASLSGGVIKGMGSVSTTDDAAHKRIVEAYAEGFRRQGETPERAKELAEAAASPHAK